MNGLGIVAQLRADIAADFIERAVLDMCDPCWDDLCIACQGGRCRCACQDWDEPPVRPLPVREKPARCGTCGYAVRGLNHRTLCGRTP